MIPVRWEDERYVRLYTRDTATWKLLPWQGRALLPLLLRKCDRAGIVEAGDDLLEGVAALVDLPLDVVEVGLPALLRRGVVVARGEVMVFPNFLSAQEAKASDKVRAKEYRERSRRHALSDGVVIAGQLCDENVTHRDEASQNVTDRHAESRGVTPRHAPSHGVTPSCADPSRTNLLPLGERQAPAVADAPPVEGQLQLLGADGGKAPAEPKKARKKPEAPPMPFPIGDALDALVGAARAGSQPGRVETSRRPWRCRSPGTFASTRP